MSFFNATFSIFAKTLIFDRRQHIDVESALHVAWLSIVTNIEVGTAIKVLAELGRAAQAGFCLFEERKKLP